MTTSTLTRRARPMMPGMAPFLAHPLRLTQTGTFATVDDTGDAYLGQAVHIIAATRIGERQMAPGFGVPEATWASVREDDVAACLALYGPQGIEIESTVTTQVGPQRAVTAVTWAAKDNL